MLSELSPRIGAHVSCSRPRLAGPDGGVQCVKYGAASREHHLAMPGTDADKSPAGASQRGGDPESDIPRRLLHDDPAEVTIKLGQGIMIQTPRADTVGQIPPRWDRLTPAERRQGLAAGVADSAPGGRSASTIGCRGTLGLPIRASL